MTYLLGYLMGLFERNLQSLKDDMHEGYCAAISKEEDDV